MIHAVMTSSPCNVSARNLKLSVASSVTVSSLTTQFLGKLCHVRGTSMVCLLHSRWRPKVVTKPGSVCRNFVRASRHSLTCGRRHAGPLGKHSGRESLRKAAEAVHRKNKRLRIFMAGVIGRRDLAYEGSCLELSGARATLYVLKGGGNPECEKNDEDHYR